MTGILRNFAVFEGGDGSGTTTQLALLAQRLNHGDGPAFFPTCEPTGGPAGGLIRSALKKEITLLPETLARLFAADRGEHLYGPAGLVERCGRGALAVSDRYLLSSLVYQGIECGDSLPRILNDPFPGPELLLFFDLDPRTALERMRSRGRLEIYEYLEFQQKVREKYLSLLDETEKSGVRVAVINAEGSPEEVAAAVWREIEKMPIVRK
jgi:dTMP kinase